MNIKDARNLLDEILELCSQVEDQILNDAAEGIYRDAQSAKTPEHILRCASELMIFVNDTPWDDQDPELKSEMERIFLDLQEGCEDFE
jgi:hypothetical protein